MSTESEYLTAGQVMARYGNVSHMWILRKQKDEGFPQAIKFGGRLRFFKLTELENWERSKIAGVATKPKQNPKSKRAA